MRDFSILSAIWQNGLNEFKSSKELFNIPNEDNLLRLDKAIKGKARDSIEFPRNVSEIIKMLGMNFGPTEWIILSLKGVKSWNSRRWKIKKPDEFLKRSQ